MKKIIVSLMMLGMFSLLSNAQQNNITDYYYYYKGEKLYLEINTLKAIVVYNNTVSTFINNSSMVRNQYNIDKILSHEGYQEIYFLDTVPSSVYLNRLSALNSTINYQNPIEPYLKIGTDDQIRMSNYFHVKLKQLFDTTLLFAKANEMHADIVSQNKYMPLWFVLRNNGQGLQNKLTTINAFYESGLFQAAEPDLNLLKVDLSCESINDPLWGSQWNLNNTGQYNSKFPTIDVRACNAWELAKGENTVVAIVDRGIFYNHPDLQDNIFPIAYDALHGSIGFGYYGSHGTSVASVVGARQNNNIGLTGIAPECKLMSIAASDGGMTMPPDTAVVKCADGIHFAWKNGAGVINNSWQSSIWSGLEEAIDSALTYGRNGKGCILVFASGNSGASTVRYPAKLSNVIAVGNINPDGKRQIQGNYGITSSSSDYGIDLDIVAPGTLIPIISADTFNTDHGTSVAAPHVSGVAALILSANPNLTQQEVRKIIESTAQKVRADTYTYQNTPNRLNGTWHEEMGYGLVNAHAAVFKALFYDKAIVGNRIMRLCESGIYSLGNTDYPDSVKFLWETSSDMHIIEGRTSQSVRIQGLSGANSGISIGWIKLTVSHKGETEVFSKNIILWDDIVRTNYTVQQNETWSSNGTISGMLTIESGAVLTIHSTMKCSPDVKIIVKPGGKLIVDGGILTNCCDNTLWQGIEVWGDPSIRQTYPVSYRPWVDDYHGFVELTNGAVIENAQCGIYVGCRDAYPACGGGVVIAKNSKFRNNYTAIKYTPYVGLTMSPQPSEIANLSCFTDCHFFVDDGAFFNVIEDNAMVYLYGVKDVEFQGCDFIDMQTKSTPPSSGTGLYANAASVVIKGSSPELPPDVYYLYPPPPPSKHSSFSGFFNAIVLTNTGTRSSKLKYIDFSDNVIGIQAVISDQLTTMHCRFDLQQAYVHSGHGMVLEYCNAYIIQDNEFKGIGIDDNGTGLYITETGIGNNYVVSNTFSNICVATSAEEINGKNANNINDCTGLQYRCNTFTDNKGDIYIGKNSSNIRYAQGTLAKGAGNKFNSSTIAINNLSSNNGLIYFYNTTQANHYPTGYTATIQALAGIQPVTAHSCDGYVVEYPIIIDPPYPPYIPITYSIGVKRVEEGYTEEYQRPNLEELYERYTVAAKRLEERKWEYDRWYPEPINWKELVVSGRPFEDIAQVKLFFELVDLQDEITLICRDALYICTLYPVLDKKEYYQWLYRSNTPASLFLLAKGNAEVGDCEQMQSILDDILKRFPDCDEKEYAEYVRLLQYECQWVKMDPKDIYQEDINTLLYYTWHGLALKKAQALLEYIGIRNTLDIIFFSPTQFCTEMGGFMAPFGNHKNLQPSNPTETTTNLEQGKPILHLYPNPSKDVVYIVVENTTDVNIAQLKVYDIYGRLLRTTNDIGETQTEIDLSGLAASIYYVRCGLDNGELKTKRIVKE
jgi:hypothetical protein